MGYVEDDPIVELSYEDFREYNSENYETLVKELRQMGSNFVNRIVPTFKNTSKRYISDVLAFISSTEANTYYRILSEYGSSYSRNLFLIVLKYDHIHLVHDCSYLNKNCRCSWSQNKIV